LRTDGLSLCDFACVDLRAFGFLFYVGDHFFGSGCCDFGAFPRGVFYAEAFLLVPVVFADVFVASGASVEVPFGFVLCQLKRLFVFFMPFWRHTFEPLAHGVGAAFYCVSSAASRDF
jgi:hypothetical protein